MDPFTDSFSDSIVYSGDGNTLFLSMNTDTTPPSYDRFSRLCWASLKTVRWHHLMSDFDDQLLIPEFAFAPAASKPASSAQGSTQDHVILWQGYTEWTAEAPAGAVKSGSTSLTLGWDWVFDAQISRDIMYRRTGFARSNIMIVGSNHVADQDLGPVHTETFLNHLIDGLPWQKALKVHLGQQYSL